MNINLIDGKNPQDVPAAGSRYVIEGGRASSWISGTHWTSGGVYVTATVETTCGSDCYNTSTKTAVAVSLGEMNAVYRDSNAPPSAKSVLVTLGQNDHQNFISQFDDKGNVYWARFVGMNGMAGKVNTTGCTSESLIISGSYGEFGGQASSIDDFYVGVTITLVAGDLAGYSRHITRYVASTRNLTVFPPLPSAPNSSTAFIISNRGTATTAATSSTPSAVILSDSLGLRATLDNAFVGQLLVVTRGAAIGQAAVIQAYDGSTRTARVNTLTNLASGDEIHIFDSSSIQELAVMRDTIFMTVCMITSDTRAQNCSFDSATVTEGPPDNTQPIMVFECAVIGTLPPVVNPNGASKTECAIAGSSSTDVSFGSLKSTTTWGMYTLAYNGSGSLLWTHVVHVGAIFPKAILAMDPSIGGAPRR